MKWLKDYVDVSDIDIKEFCNRMTMSGSKVEGYRVEGQELENIVVGEIIKIEKHPDADKLLVCQVDIGAGENKLIQIVTAAKNIFEGAIVPVALHKSKIAGGVSIKKGKLRGVMSEGMFCSVSELNLTLNDFPGAIEDGILIIDKEYNYSLGQDIKTVLGIDDIIIDFEITPNRPDCLSVIGLAREVSAVFKRPIKYYKSNNQDIKNNNIINNIIKVTNQEKELCKRYIAKAVKNIKIKPSPRFIRERLRSSGLRPINNIVDITNYVMLEYGQPIHAFDLDKINNNNIIIRKATQDEKIKLLDGVEKKLNPDVLVIADETRPLAVAGVMGGEDSGINKDTKTVIFEVASFDQESVRQTSKKLGVRTESSSRFEKNTDGEFLTTVVDRICQLIKELEAGEIIEDHVDINNSNNIKQEIKLDFDFINKRLGEELSEQEIKDILANIFIEVKDNKALVPSWRPDLMSLADIVEEIARFYGYDKIKSKKFNLSINSIAMRTDRQKFKNNIMDFMASQGYFEIQTFSFISPKSYDKINLDKDQELRNSINILNPLGEDTSVMRSTALPSMLDVISKNYNNQNQEGNFFEIAKEYYFNNNQDNNNNFAIEKEKLIIGSFGKKYSFYDLKSLIENLFDWVEVLEPEFVAQNNNSVFHPGRCADIYINNKKIGTIGQIHPVVSDNYQVGVNVFVASLDIDEIFNYRVTNKLYTPISKFPSVTRDLSLVCDKDLPVGVIEKLIQETVLDILEEINLVDIYQGEQVEKSKKSVCYSLRLRNSKKTLTDDEIDIIINRVLEKLRTIDVYIRQF
ncbi:MAG: phenylalanine--tRNA ligase subunit beta [Oscillospiraceae bacterium]|nr:phenylalanine--tRNA ligase subunit beta [Oscillospiraceae bacterium]